MTVERAKVQTVVEWFISTEIPPFFMVANYMWKLLRVWKLWHPLEGRGVPSTWGTTIWLLWNTAVCQGSYSLRVLHEQWPEKAAGAAIQVVLSLCHHLQSVLDSRDLVPSKAWHCKGTQRQPELRHVPGARGLVCPSPVCATCVLRCSVVVSAKGWWPRLATGVATGVEQLFLHTFCVPPHSICSHCVCHRSVCHPSRDCSVCVGTELLTSLCRGSLCLNKLWTQVSSGVIPSPAIMLSYTKMIGFHHFNIAH